MGLWYLSRHAPAEALAVMRARIRAYNDAVGTVNSDSSGYHETLTWLYLRGLAAHRAAMPGEAVRESFGRLLASPVADRRFQRSPSNDASTITVPKRTRSRTPRRRATTRM